MIDAGPAVDSSKSFAASPLSDRTGFLDIPSADSKSDFAYTGGPLERLVFITPAAISMFLISFVTIWGARVSPAVTVIFICCYVSYGWVKGIHSAVFSLVVGIPRCHAYKAANWQELAKNPQLQSPILERTFGPQGPVFKPGHPPLPIETAMSSSAAGVVKQGLGLTAKFESIIHVCVIPTYKEPLGTLRKTVGTLHSQSCAKDKLIICLATESRDDEAPEKVKALMAEFGDGLLGFFYTTHVLVPGEAVGKSSNTAWAVRCVKHTLVDVWGFLPDEVMLTICDADTYFDTQFMDCLAYHHVQDPTPYNTTYQAVECFFPNIWAVPIIVRIKALIDSVGFLGQLASPFSHPFPFAIYSQSLRTAIECGYWDVDIIPEDWHHFLKCWFRRDGNFRVIPIFLFMGNDAIEDENWFAANKARYTQAKRHAWGAIDLAYIVCQYLNRMDRVPFRKVYKLFSHAAEHHISWTLYWITVMLGSLVSTWVNPELETYPFGIGLRKLAMLCFLPMMFATTMFMIGDFYIRMFLLHDRRHFEANVAPIWWQLLSQIQWLLMPVADLFFGSMAGLDAQLHMAFQPTMIYEVSTKVAKN
mmetsp:Transcript_37366/g.92423  ORF Transcript_37366/g.92423 Transcript_37366/m.92423 type:complete len:588 (-) Transcript_37366:336-2099(-)|eukprot:CAMPEP_0197574498 /NCGR_PEP_ID=MMETSP1326-20131121/211_1 /TAXON_ID=1155430 /ORGANISM="Genus nov. species nov., Strain RCC2288" /LENGTH=587 /DNA_ID=CAMNT_0043137091 /DNA_START=43 /DNA_END=1806 /DNA_ORIENTATION=-